MAHTKKANAFIETIGWAIALLALSVTVVVVLMYIDNFNASIADDDTFPAPVKAWANEQQILYVSLMDHVFMIFLVGSWIAALMMAIDIGSSTIFAWISFALGIFAIAFVVIVVEVYGDFSSAAGVASFVIQFPKMHYVMQNLVKVGVGFFFTVIIAFFAKSSIQ